jgi:hypothetical protein
MILAHSRTYIGNDCSLSSNSNIRVLIVLASHTSDFQPFLPLFNYSDSDANGGFLLEIRIAIPLSLGFEARFLVGGLLRGTETSHHDHG